MIPTPESLYEEYMNLQKYIPANIRERFDELDNEGEILSEQILKINRINTYFIASNQQDLHFENAELFKIINSEIETSVSLFCPNLIQPINSMIKSIINDPSQFGKMFVQTMINKKKKVPQFLIYVTIPSIFSNFSNKAANLLALRFYNYVSCDNKVPYQTFINIVDPFFQCCGVTNFAKSVFKELLMELLNNDMSIEDYVKKMLKISLSKFCLLPDTHVSLINFLRINWTPNKIWELLIKDLILPQYRIYSQIYPYPNSPKSNYQYKKVNKFLLLIINRKDNSSFFPKLEVDSTYFSIPDSFLKNEQSLCIESILTKTDLIMIRKIVGQYIEREDLDNELESIQENRPFLVKTFPKSKLFTPSSILSQSDFLFFNYKPHKIAQDSYQSKLWDEIKSTANSFLIDPISFLMALSNRKFLQNSNLQKRLDLIDFAKFQTFVLNFEINNLHNDAYYFERILLNQMVIKQLNQWKDLSNESVDNYSYLISCHYSIENKIIEKSPSAIVRKFYNFINDCPVLGNVPLYLTLLLLSHVENFLNETFEKRIKDMTARFNRIFKKGNLFNETITFQNQEIQLSFWNSYHIISSGSSQNSLIERYFILLGFIENLFNLNHALGNNKYNTNYIDSLLKFIFMLVDCSWISETLMFLNATLFLNENISSILTFEYKEFWNYFTVIFLRVCKTDEKFIILYGKLYKRIQTKFEQLYFHSNDI